MSNNVPLIISNWPILEKNRVLNLGFFYNTKHYRTVHEWPSLILQQSDCAKTQTRTICEQSHQHLLIFVRCDSKINQMFRLHRSCSFVPNLSPVNEISYVPNNYLLPTSNSCYLNFSLCQHLTQRIPHYSLLIISHR